MIGGTGQCYIKQPVALLRLRFVPHRPRLGEDLRLLLLAGRPDRQRPADIVQGRAVIARPGRLIDDQNQRRFEPLGAMHGHHADFAPLGFQIAADLALGAGKALQKGREGRRLRMFGGERFREEGVDRVTRLDPQPRHQTPAPALGAKQGGKEGKGAVAARRVRASAHVARAQPAPWHPQPPHVCRARHTG